MFGFNTVERTIFKRNFLRRVSLKINFNKNIESLNEDTIKSLFLKTFPRITKVKGNDIKIILDSNSPTLQASEGNDCYILKSANGQIVLEIRAADVLLYFEPAAYKSSQNIKDILPLLKDFIKEQDIDKITLNKINIIEFENVGNPNSILYYLLNKNIIGNIDSFPNSEFIDYNIQSINYKNDEYSLNIKYGLNLPSINIKVGQVILDLEASKYTKSNIHNLESIFEKLNTEIFNIFNMLISDNTKRILNGEES